VKFVLTLMITLVLAGGLAQALPLFPATSIPSTPTTPPLAPGQEVSVVPPIVNMPWSTVSGSSGSTGTYSTAVYFDNATGGLDFVYQFTNIGSGIDTADLSEVTAQNFAGFTTDVSFVGGPGVPPGPIATLPPGTVFTAGPGLINAPGPTAIFRTGDATSVGFNFDGSATDIKTGQTSETFIIQTNATHFTAGVIGITAGPTTNVFGWQPAAVPEPAMILPAGLALLGLLAFRRKAQSKA